MQGRPRTWRGGTPGDARSVPRGDPASVTDAASSIPLPPPPALHRERLPWCPTCYRKNDGLDSVSQQRGK